MQPRPTAEEILRDVAALLDDVLVPALSGPAQHQARVAASLIGIVHREVRLSASNDAAERDAWARLLVDRFPANGDLLTLRRAAADALRAGLADDPAVEAEVWPVLMEATRADLAIVKPGHDSWDGDLWRAPISAAHSPRGSPSRRATASRSTGWRSRQQVRAASTRCSRRRRSRAPSGSH